MNKIKITILAISPKYSALWNYSYFLEKHLSKEKYEVEFIDLWQKNEYHSNISRGFALLNGIKTKNTDVLILIDPLLCNSLKKSDAKLKIVVVHDLYPITHPAELSINSIGTKFSTNTSYPAMKYADILLPVSDFTRENIKKILRINKEAKTIHGGINHDFFKINNEIKSEKLKMPQRKKIFLHVGRNDSRKNFMFALELFRRFENSKLIKIGSISKKEKSFIEKNNLDVEIIDSVSNEELAKYYNEADLLLFPSNYEGLGLPPAEAMACGCPVIAANNTGLKEVCIKESLLPLNLGLWEEKARKIIENKEYRTKIIKKGLNKAKEFDWKKYAKEVEKTIDEKLDKTSK